MAAKLLPLISSVEVVCSNHYHNYVHKPVIPLNCLVVIRSVIRVTASPGRA